MVASKLVCTIESISDCHAPLHSFALTQEAPSLPTVTVCVFLWRYSASSREVLPSVKFKQRLKQWTRFFEFYINHCHSTFLTILVSRHTDPQWSLFYTVLSESRCPLRLRYGTGSGLYRRWWTSLPTPFISAQRLSERRSAKALCE
jgi:hypothetical protein